MFLYAFILFLFWHNLLEKLKSFKLRKKNFLVSYFIGTIPSSIYCFFGRR
jgi:hypothetical protein